MTADRKTGISRPILLRTDTSEGSSNSGGLSLSWSFSTSFLAALGILSLLVGYGLAAAATTSSTAAPNAFPISTSAPSYTGAANIVIYGNYSASSSVSVTITNPKDVQVGAANPAVQENGTFSATFNASWPTWDVSGTYTVTAMANIADFTGVPPTSVITFDYTAVPPASTTSSASSQSFTQASTTSAPLSVYEILPFVAVTIIVVLLVGVLLSRRGGGAPARGAPANRPN